MSGFLIVNPRSGKGGPDPGDLRAEAERRGIATHVLGEGDDPAALAREAEPPLGVAGGDGSLAAVAEVALERDAPFVAVPYGTRNHFARDLGLDRDDPMAALEAFAGSERRIDVGRVNDRLFLNNVSLGLYARLVHRREGHRRRQEIFARLRALGMLARRPRPLRITIDGRPVEARVALVANNAYKLDLFSIGERERLDEGLLHLHVAHGWLPTSWDDETGERFTIDAATGRLTAAVDGEPEELETPLRFEVRPQALRVLLPQL
ncbi:MAG TPA: diacylglycerol kinase family protein [Gaiellaceae bacterium]|nr:diacylglycerol kinase family protein [Gaiellaceae bacterium]